MTQRGQTDISTLTCCLVNNKKSITDKPVSVNESMNYGGDCRTALATPGLLITDMTLLLN